MNRITITNEDGEPDGWFDEARATKYGEESYHDGRNFISRATGTQWDHEQLYRTAKGAWVLNAWSQWQGSRETYRRISDEEAAAWLVTNEHEPPKSLASAVALQEV